VQRQNPAAALEIWREMSANQAYFQQFAQGHPNADKNA
jgi:hypothetical protein